MCEFEVSESEIETEASRLLLRTRPAVVRSDSHGTQSDVCSTFSRALWLRAGFCSGQTLIGLRCIGLSLLLISLQLEGTEAISQEVDRNVPHSSYCNPMETTQGRHKQCITL